MTKKPARVRILPTTREKLRALQERDGQKATTKRRMWIEPSRQPAKGGTPMSRNIFVATALLIAPGVHAKGAKVERVNAAQSLNAASSR